MNRMKAMASALAPMLMALLFGLAVAQTAPETGALTANTGLYPADFGPAEIDVSEYPPLMKKYYKVFAFKCAACHTIARPINSQFIELNEEEQSELKKVAPVLLKDKRLGIVEEKIWNRYVKRMMSKPGCPVKGDDGKQIWEFLAYDSRQRKTGANAKAWVAERAKMVEDFKRDYPDAYKTVFENMEPEKEGKKEEKKGEKD